MVAVKSSLLLKETWVGSITLEDSQEGKGYKLHSL